MISACLIICLFLLGRDYLPTLIAEDSDFVPAAKPARRAGIDFILDPLHTAIKPDLFEHIAGLRIV
jgi:hypothetical protein